MKLIDYSVGFRNRTVLSHADVSFPAGRINHLLGKNGSGKSTFAKSLAGLIPHGGIVSTQGGKVSVIGSYSGLPLDLHVSDVIRAAEAHSDGNACRRLYQGLNIASIQEGLRLRRLSDGQRQKLKILFFLSKNPKVIVLDECTSALDQTSTRTIRSFFNKYLNRPEITSINITHDLSDLTEMPGANYLLEDGHIEKDLPTKTIVRRYIGGGVPC